MASKPVPADRSASDVLLEAILELSSARTLDRVMSIVRHAARGVSGADGATFVLRDGEFCYYADEDAIAPLWKGRRFPAETCISGWAMRHRRTVVIEDIFKDPRIPQDAYRPTFVKSLAMVPVRVEDPVAAIGAYWARRHRATEEETGLLQALANAASVAMSNEELYRRNRRAEQRLQLALDSARLGAWDYDPRNDLLDLDASCRRICGFGPDLPVDLPSFLARIHPDDRAQLDRLRGPQPADPLQGLIEMEFRVVPEPGVERWIAATSKPTAGPDTLPVRFAGTMRDITDAKRDDERRRQAELAAAVSDLHLRALFDVMPQLGWVARPDGTIEFCNRGWFEYTGVTLEQMHGPAWQSLPHADDVPAVIDGWHHSLATGEPFEMEYRLRRRDGAYRWFLTRSVPIRDETGTVVRWIGISTDIHDRREADEERDTLLKQAEAASRAKDEFLAMLGHELRNPLSPIVTALHLIRLRNTVPDTPELAIIDRQVRHLVRLVDDLLDVSRIKRGKILLDRRPVELGHAVAHAVEMVAPLLDHRRHQFTVDVPAQGLVVQGDEARLAQVIANLLRNAAGYTEPGGRVELSARRDGEHAVLTVRDSGIGIESELLPHVFDLFVQGRRGIARTEGGLGLGLALVQNLVVLHGGSVEARSRGRHHGSEFIVRLPLSGSERAVETRTGGPVENSAVLPSGTRILLVDDNEDAAHTMAAALRERGAHVAVAHDGPEALDLAAGFAPDVAVLDIGLPLMDGFELARRLREEPGLDSTRLVALTGYGQPADRVKAHESGFEHHLVKPVDIGKLVTLLANLVGSP